MTGPLYHICSISGKSSSEHKPHFLKLFQSVGQSLLGCLRPALGLPESEVCGGFGVCVRSPAAVTVHVLHIYQERNKTSKTQSLDHRLSSPLQSIGSNRDQCPAFSCDLYPAQFTTFGSPQSQGNDTSAPSPYCNSKSSSTTGLKNSSRSQGFGLPMFCRLSAVQF